MNYLKQWQEKHGLTPDGVIGKKTMKAMMNCYHIESTVAFTMWIAQCKHESLNFTRGRENLNYRWDALLSTFNTRTKIRFTKKEAMRWGRTSTHVADQVAIANQAYADRMGNGNFHSGDGWHHRGGGALQTTGADNYKAYFDWINLPLDTNPCLLEEPDHYFGSAIFWFNSNGAWNYCKECSKTNIHLLSSFVNAGTPSLDIEPKGLKERIMETELLYDRLVLA